MKGYRCTLSALLAAVGGFAGANVYIFDPPAPTLDNLDHSKAYAWSITPSIPGDQIITSATLTINDIYDWQVETNILTVDLLNNPPAYGTSTTTGTHSNYLVTKDDTQSGSYWEHPGSWGGWKQMFTWSDADGPATHNKLVYDFNNLYVYDASGTHLLSTTPSTGADLTTLANYIASGGSFGLGFDPDCHFYNSGVELKIETTTALRSVPSPFAALPFAVGFLVALRRRAR